MTLKLKQSRSNRLVAILSIGSIKANASSIFDVVAANSFVKVCRWSHKPEGRGLRMSQGWQVGPFGLLADSADGVSPYAVLEPERQASAWMRLFDAVEFVLQPPFD